MWLVACGWFVWHVIGLCAASTVDDSCVHADERAAMAAEVQKFKEICLRFPPLICMHTMIPPIYSHVQSVA